MSSGAFSKQLKSLISNGLFKSQSSLRLVLRDEIKSRARGLSKSAKIVSGSLPERFHSELHSLVSKIEQEGVGRGNNSDGKNFSITVSKTENSPAFDYIIEKHKNLIVGYLGKNFLVNDIRAWRNYPIEKSFQNYDIYSNVWHQDSHDGNRLLKIFLLLQDVSETDGPFTYLSEDATKKNWQQLSNRYHIEVAKGTQHYEDEQHVTGKFGDYLILDTARSAHRASVPKVSRDMAQVTMFPAWHPKNGRKEYKIA